MNPTPMLTLAIDTSGTVGSIALGADGNCLEERTLELGRHHGQSLIPEIRQLLSRHGRSPRDCGLVAVSIGPGSFTGLRVGVVCAKTLAYAIGCPVAGVPTHLAIACNSPDELADVFVVSDAQRGDLFVQPFHHPDQGRWRAAGEMQIVAAGEWAAQLPSGTAISGPALEKFAELFSARLRLLEFTCWRPRATWIARLGLQMSQEGPPMDLWSLEPLYLRKSSAEEKWDLRRLPPYPRGGQGGG